jgi:hypothetical protein
MTKEHAHMSKLALLTALLALTVSASSQAQAAGDAKEEESLAKVRALDWVRGRAQ